MLRFFLILLMPLALGACLPEEEDDKLTNDQGDTVSDPTLRLNGLWNGQLDQAGAMRTLIYNGNLFAFDEELAYYGSVELDEESAGVTFNVSAFTYSSTDSSAIQMVADGTGDVHTFSGLLYPTTEVDDTVVGDYEGESAVGSFMLSNDGTWTDRSALALLKGQWSATGNDLYFTQVNEELSFREVSTTVVGCTSRGTVTLIDPTINLYAVSMTERKNCDGFNVTNAPGYATINADGDLELFLRRDGALFYARYSPGGATTDTDTDAGTDTGTEDTGA